MSDAKTRMNDEEFMDFINDNRDRIKALMEDDDDFRQYLKTKAKEAKEKVSEKSDRFEETVKDVFRAMFAPEVQKHVIGAGVEMMLGINAFLKSLPVPDKAKGIVDSVEEVRHNVSSAYCSANPDCSRRKGDQRSEPTKIELD